MNSSASQGFCLNEWQVDPVAGHISRKGTSIKLEHRHMRVLVLLAEHAGEFLTAAQIEKAIWGRTNAVTNVLHQAISQLRRVLGDDAKRQLYIQAVALHGYRLIAKVSPDPGLAMRDLQQPAAAVSSTGEIPALSSRPTWSRRTLALLTGSFARDRRVASLIAVAALLFVGTIGMRAYPKGQRENGQAHWLPRFILNALSPGSVLADRGVAVRRAADDSMPRSPGSMLGDCSAQDPSSALPHRAGSRTDLQEPCAPPTLQSFDTGAKNHASDRPLGMRRLP